jgi:hypothetical protein
VAFLAVDQIVSVSGLSTKERKVGLEEESWKLEVGTQR